MIPFLAVLGHIFTAGRKLIFLESTSLAIASFILFYVSSIYFLKKAKIKLTYINLLPFIWLASFGYTFIELYLNPSWRGFEMGLSFITFMLVAMIFYRDIKVPRTITSKSIFVIIALLIGIITYSDPYYLWFTIGPIILFTAISYGLKKIKKDQLLTIYVAIILSFIFSRLASYISMKAGIRVVTTYPAAFVNFNSLSNNLTVGAHGLLLGFGADFFGQKIKSLIALGAVMNALLLGYIIYKIYQLRRTHVSDTKTDIAQYWTIFFGALCVLVFGVYVISTLVDISTYRYLIMLILSAILFLSLTMSTIKSKIRRNTIATIIVIATVFNIGISIHETPGYQEFGSLGNNHNSLNYQLINTVRSLGINKGYTNYWQGNINTYLSDNTIQFLPILCTAGHTATFNWLINPSSFQLISSKSFYLIDPNINGPPTCSVQQVISQFGTPNKVVKVSDNSLYIYNYDIGTKM
jgi:hypothetical protein